MTSRTVHLGFEVGSAAPVEIPIFHMAVTGQTQKSGKTTALEAVIDRAKLRAIAFITKRGEGSFQSARRIKPYFKERTDWQFVQSILETILRQGQQYKQPWIMRACEGARTLADVRRRAHQLELSAKNSLSQDMYMVLGAYLDNILPSLASLPKASTVELAHKGLVVMDLVQYPLELQMLVMSSTLQWIFEHEENVISIIPEAWEFIPEAKNTPVKFVAERLARKGAGLGNFLWIDSQDLAAVANMMLRPCEVWLIGNQREANEVKRSLANMPAGMKKPKAADLQTLGLGQFFVCHGNEIRKTYVQPAWMDENDARAIAAGRLNVHDLAVSAKAPTKESDHLLGLTPAKWGTDFESLGYSTNAKEPAQAGRPVEAPAGTAARSQSPIRVDQPQMIAQEEEEVPIDPQTLEALKLAIQDGAKDTALGLLASISGTAVPLPAVARAEAPYTAPARAHTPQDKDGYCGEECSAPSNEALYQAFKKRLVEEAPGILVSLTKNVPEMEVREIREKITRDTSTPEGRVAFLIAKGYFGMNRINADVVAELGRLGMPTLAPNVKRAFDVLTEKGFLVAKEKGRYSAVEGMKVNIIAA